MVWPLLKDPEPKVRSLAAQALIRHGADMDRVEPLLRDEAATVREAVATAMILAGAQKRKFVELLDDEDSNVRERVGVALIEAGAKLDIVSGLLKDDEATVRKSVGAAVAENFGPRPELTPLLSDEDDEVRAAVGVGLANAGCAPERIWFLLEDEDATVREQVAFALLHRQSVERKPLLSALLDSKLLTHQVCWSFGPKSRALMIPLLIERLKSSSEKQRDSAYRMLRQLELFPASAVEQLRPLMSSDNLILRRRACTLVAKTGTGAQSVLNELRECLKASDSELRVAAIMVASVCELKMLLPELRQLLTDTDKTVRYRAAGAVARFDSANRECIALLLKAAEYGKWSNVSPATSGARVVPHEKALRKGLSEQKQTSMSRFGNSVRDSASTQACLAIVKSGGQESLRMIERWLQDKETPVRALKRSLVLLATWDADLTSMRPVLVGLLDHTSGDVRVATLRVLL